MTIRMLTDLDQALAAAGIPFVPIGRSSLDPTGAADWSTRTRPLSAGNFNPVGVLCHHTASPAGTSDQADLNVILAGNSEAPGPISQLFVGRSATVYLVAAGRANHAGHGCFPGEPCQDMNAQLVGIEAANNGRGERWPDIQTTMYARVVAALCAHYHWSVDIDVLLHATTGPPCGNSKIDPAGPWQGQPGSGTGTWDLNRWRTFVVANAATAPGPSPTPPSPSPAPSPEGDDSMFINMGTWATFAAAGGTCTWIGSATDADAVGVPKGSPTRGAKVSPQFFRGLVLYGPLPTGDTRTWSADDFAAHKPSG